MMKTRCFRCGYPCSLPELLRLGRRTAEGAEIRGAPVPVAQGPPAGHPVHPQCRFVITVGGELRLPKIGNIAVRWSRPLPSEPSSVTVIKDAAGRYFASFVVEAEPASLPETGAVLGIDLGLTHFAVLSGGRKIAAPRFLRRAEKKLRRAQKALSRKDEGSMNRDRARGKLARAHAQVADGRREFHHQLSTALIRENQRLNGKIRSVKGHDFGLSAGRRFLRDVTVGERLA
jgi:transposase